jgi:hypothetical protein
MLTVPVAARIPGVKTEGVEGTSAESVAVMETVHGEAKLLEVVRDCVRAAPSRTFCTTGSSRPMRIAMMAITTSSSKGVNPPRRRSKKSERFMVIYSG